ncbi:hypothetical protein EDC56_1027 [Sinobacterium caligoides]|uniref:OAA-family lectin sugar binding domain-containing protein n=1 Tax=Sinobacterium caligoides TaxID=933926 RepID=A0A3N2E0F2_9GAMM|nr:lectin ESA-2 [Sinobacterium caligoides]ROS05497.1 hypothetical protein EDC56_1027 [Sinobacterium caligoides]
MALYQVENQWGGNSAPWHEGGKWIIGSRDNQNPIAVDLQSFDGGKTLKGTMSYEGEGVISVRATRHGCNNYRVENQWGGSDAQWHDAGQWILGFRADQSIIALSVKSTDGGNTLSGTTTYESEGAIGFNASRAPGEAFTVVNQWGGSQEPWREGGTWVLGSRLDQAVIAIDVQSNDNGKTLTGTMTYANEGAIGFKASLIGANNYKVQNQWGGSSAPWQPAGIWVIGYRNNQPVTALSLLTDDQGETLSGEMTYLNEGSIAISASVVGETEPA